MYLSFLNGLLKGLQAQRHARLTLKHLKLVAKKTVFLSVKKSWHVVCVKRSKTFILTVHVRWAVILLARLHQREWRELVGCQWGNRSLCGCHRGWGASCCVSASRCQSRYVIEPVSHEGWPIIHTHLSVLWIPLLLTALVLLRLFN